MEKIWRREKVVENGGGTPTATETTSHRMVVAQLFGDDSEGK